MTALLQDVIERGTVAMPGWAVSSVSSLEDRYEHDGRDAWFVGYSSRLLTLVWVGFDNNKPHGLTGAEAALPIWTEFMRRARDV